MEDRKEQEMKKRTSNIQRSTSNVECGAASRAVSVDPRSPLPRGQAYTCESRCGDDKKGRKMKKRGPRRAGTSLRSAVDGRQKTLRLRSIRQAHGKQGRQEEDGRRPFDKLRTRKTGGAWVIKLTFGKFAVIDAEDYDRVSQYNWCGIEDTRCWYAHTLKRDGTPMAMHRLILNAPKGLLVDHIDHNGLNNRKSNLRLCTNSQNQQNTRPRRGGTSR